MQGWEAVPRSELPAVRNEFDGMQAEGAVRAVSAGIGLICAEWIPAGNVVPSDR